MMLPAEDAGVVRADLTRRFGLARWQITLSATDANRSAIRMARHATGRDKVLWFSYSCHGGVDETFAVAGPGGATVARENNVGPPVDVALTTRAVEFNDVDALRAALAHGDVACVIAEPAMTNMGIILPEPGFHEHLRALTRAAGTLLVIDETHTLAGNALSLAAMRAALTRVLTEEGFARARTVCDRLRDGIEHVIADHDLPWHSIQLGTRVEYRFTSTPPTDGTARATAWTSAWSASCTSTRSTGGLVTPFHPMLLASPATTEADADVHTQVFGEAVRALFA